MGCLATQNPGLPRRKEAPHAIGIRLYGDQYSRVVEGMEGRRCDLGGNGKRRGDPPLGLCRLVCLGRDLWEELFSLAGSVRGAETLESADSEEEEPDGQQDLDETHAERIYLGLLDLEPAPQESREVSLWPRAWQEERIWGDLDSEARRRLRDLLEG
jgi:hypothetical protein